MAYDTPMGRRYDIDLDWDSVRIEPWNPEWAAAYAAISDRVRVALGGVTAQFEHIGSTSVPGLPAKPVIDIGIAVS